MAIRNYGPFYRDWKLDRLVINSLISIFDMGKGRKGDVAFGSFRNVENCFFWLQTDICLSKLEVKKESNYETSKFFKRMLPLKIMHNIKNKYWKINLDVLFLVKEIN